MRPHLLAGSELTAEPAQKRSRERRARLKSAGLVLFREYGYERTSIQEITRRAKLPIGTFYQHFRSKRQLLLTLMDDLLEGLSQVEFKLRPGADVRRVVHDSLSAAFSRDVRYIGACRAWQEAVLADSELAGKDAEIHTWTTARVTNAFKLLHKSHGRRRNVDIAALARTMDALFWSFLVRAVHMRKTDLDEWVDSSTHLIFHALFKDRPGSKRP
jgi:AcrR family transcriptional regulator